MVELTFLLISVVSFATQCQWEAEITEYYHDRESIKVFSIHDEAEEFKTPEAQATCGAKKVEDPEFYGWTLICDFKGFIVIIPGLERPKKSPIQGKSFLITGDGTQVFVVMKCKK